MEKESEDKTFLLANKEWDYFVKILKTLARSPSSRKNIAEQYSVDPKTLRNYRDEALKFTIDQMASLPGEVQGYLIQEGKKGRRLRPNLEEEIKIFLSGETPGEYLKRHRLELSETIEGLMFWMNDFVLKGEPDQTIGEYIVSTREEADAIDLNLPEVGRMFTHLKNVMPELVDVESFDRLPPKILNAEFVRKLGIIADQRNFRGKCESCETRGGLG